MNFSFLHFLVLFCLLSYVIFCTIYNRLSCRRLDMYIVQPNVLIIFQLKINWDDSSCFFKVNSLIFCLKLFINSKAKRTQIWAVLLLLNWREKNYKKHTTNIKLHHLEFGFLIAVQTLFMFVKSPTRNR